MKAIGTAVSIIYKTFMRAWEVEQKKAAEKEIEGQMDFGNYLGVIPENMAN